MYDLNIKNMTEQAVQPTRPISPFWTVKSHASPEVWRARAMTPISAFLIRTPSPIRPTTKTQASGLWV